MLFDLLSVAKLLFLLAAGFVAGFYGVSVSGGGLITIPALIFTGLPIQYVIATNRFAVVWGELTGVVGFRKHVAFNRRFALLCGCIGSIGAFAGSRIVLAVDERILNVVVAFLLVGILLVLLRRKRWGDDAGSLSRAKSMLILLCMPFIGLYAGFFGAAHGVFTLMLLTSSGLGFLPSAAIGRVVGAMVAVTAAASFIQAGVIQWPQAIMLSLGWVSGGWLGVRFSVKRGANFFRWLLVAVAFASAVQLIWKTL